MSDDLSALEEAVLRQAPPGAVIIGASISPDGRHGASLTCMPSASYLMDDVFVRTDGGWADHGGGSGGGTSWTNLDANDLGVLRYGGEAPEGATSAVISYEGMEYRAPVKHGHFLLVVWDTAYRDEPHIVRFD